MFFKESYEALVSGYDPTNIFVFSGVQIMLTLSIYVVITKSEYWVNIFMLLREAMQKVMSLPFLTFLH